MDAKLVVIGGKANMGEVKLRLPMTIGRGSKADLIISHPTVSREHCKLSEVKGELLVTDNGSSNGTFVDGEKIEGPTIVRSGQILAIGPLTFRADYELPAAKKPKAPKPQESGLSETQAVDRDELDIDFLLDDAPAAEVKPAPAKKKPAAPTVEAKAPDAAKKATKPAAPEAKKDAPKAPAPAKDAPKEKAPAAPRVGETDEMDLDFLLDDVAEEKKKTPGGRDTEEIDIDDIDFGELAAEQPKPKKGDDLTTDFRSMSADKTVDAPADEFDLGDDFFDEVKPADKPAAKAPAAAAQAPAASETKSASKEKSVEAKAPTAKAPEPKAAEAKAPKIEPPAPAATEPAAVEAPTKPKKSGGMDFDFLTAGPAAAAPAIGPPKEEVSFEDVASQFDFSGAAKAKTPESVAPPKVEEPRLEVPELESPEVPAAAESEAFSFDDALIEDIAAEEKIELPAFEPPVAQDDQKLFDDFLDEPNAESPSAAAPAAEEASAESAPFEAREDELVWDETPTPEEIALDDMLVEETLAVPEAQPSEVAPPVKAEEVDLPFTEPVAPPAASELPAMPELAEAEATVAEPDVPAFDEPSFHVAADAAAVAPAERAEAFEFDAPPAEVPVFDAASEAMTLDDAIAAETPAVIEPLAVAEDEAAIEVAAEEKGDAFDFDFLSELDDDAAPAANVPLAEEPEPIAAEAEPSAPETLEEISLDLDEVPASPAAPEVVSADDDAASIYETQDIDLRIHADEDMIEAPTIEMKGPPEQAVPKKDSPFDFSGLDGKQPATGKADETIAFPNPTALAPKVEAPKLDFPKIDAPKIGAPRIAPPRIDAPKLGAPKIAPSIAPPSIAPPTPAASAPTAADDFDFLADEAPAAPAAALPEITAADSDKTEAFKFGAEWSPTASAAAEPAAAPADEDDLFGDFSPAAESDAPDVAAVPDDEFAIGPTASAPAEAMPGVMPAIGMPGAVMPGTVVPGTAKPAAKTAKPAAAKGSFLDKIKTLFSGSAKAKPAKGKKSSAPAEPAPAMKLPVAPPKPLSLDPIPLDDSPMPSFDFGGAATEEPSFDVAAKGPASPAVPGVAAPGVGMPDVTVGWTPSEASIPLDDAPFAFDEPAASPKAPAAEDAFPWDDITTSSEEQPAGEAAPLEFALDDAPTNDAVAEQPAIELVASEPAVTDEADLFGGDFFADESANPEAMAAEVPAADWNASEPIAEDAKVVESSTSEWEFDIGSEPAKDESPVVEPPIAAQPAAEQPITEETFWIDELAASDAAAPVVGEVAAPKVGSFGLLDEVALEDSAPAAAASDELMLEDAPQDASAVAADAWSLDPPSTDAPSAEGAPAEPVAEAPSLPTAPPVSNRPRSIDVNLRFGSSFRSLTGVAVRPPRFDVASMEPETPAGRSFEPRPKGTSNPAPGIAAQATPTDAAPAAGEFALGDSWSDAAAPSAPVEAASADASSADDAVLSFLDDAPSVEAPAAPAAEELLFGDDAPPANDDRTVAYLGSPKVVEEAESFLAALDDQAATAPEPAFDLDAMLADTDLTSPTAESAPAMEEAPSADAEDELSFLTLSDDLAEAGPMEEAMGEPLVAEANPEAVAHVPSAEVDLGFLDLEEPAAVPVDKLEDFRFDAPELPTAKSEAPKSEPAKNGAKPSPQPAAAAPAPKADDEELADFLRDLGM